MPEKRVITDLKDVEHADMPATDIKADFEYFVAETMTRRLLEDGQINQDEYDRIMVENRKVFKPTLSALMP